MKPLTRKILIIDDSPEDRAEMRRMLLAGSSTRYRFIEAELGVVGLGLCRDAGDGLPDVVLLDFHLPDMNAVALLAELRNGADLPPCPVVVLTGSHQPSGPELLRAGAQDYLGKSWTTAESLTRAVENSIERFALLVERKLDHQRLRAAHDSFRHLVEHSPFGIYAVDADFRLMQVSAGAQKVFENVRPLIGRDFAEILRTIWPEPFSTEAIAIFRQVLASGETYHAPSTIEKRHDTAAQESYDWKVERIIMPDGRPGAVCHFYDLSERLRYEARLREQEQRLRSLVENSPLSVVEWNRNLVITRWAGEAETTYGWSAAEVVGRPIAELGIIYEEDRPIVESVTAQLADGVTRHLTQRVRLCTKDRRVIHCVWYHSVLVDAAGQMLSVLALGEDVSAQKEAETELLLRTKELRESEARARLATEATAVGIWEWNVLTGAIRWDAQLFRIYGIAPTPHGFVHHREWSGAVLPEDLPENERILLDTVRRRGQSRREFRIHRRDDGECRDIEAVETVRTNEQGQAEWVVGTNLDITERKRAEEKVRAAKEAAEAANAAKDDFLASLSHELRTPLTPVLMTAAALASDPSLPPELRDQLAMMRRNIELEARLIDDLLDLTRISRGKLAIAPVLTDLHQLLHHTGEIVRSDFFGREVRVIFQLEAARHHALVDGARLQQVFWNLLRNALKFTPDGGTVTIRSHNAGDMIVVTFVDTGIGISAENLPRLFKAFEQGDAAGQHRYGGLGLGLAISRAIAEMHGSTLSAASPGRGLGATFTLSLVTAQPPSSTLGTAAGHPASDRPLRLLVVEDHESSRVVLTRLLSRCGHHVTSVATVREALAVYANTHFDVVISDLGLPDGSGLDLMRDIQRQRPIPGIALSGYGMENDLRQTREAGFFAHLVKPVKVDQLRVLLASVPSPKITE